MDSEIELLTQSWNSATEGREGLLQGLLPQVLRSEIEAFSLPKQEDDEVSLRDWQLGLRSSESTVVHPFKPSKRSARARTFKPVQPWIDEFVVVTAPTAPRSWRTSASGKRSDYDSPPEGDLSLPELLLSNGDDSDADEITGGESPGITFDLSRLYDAELDHFNNRARPSSLRVSFEDEVKISRSLSPQGVAHRSSSMPKMKPTLLGVRAREAKDSTLVLPLPEIETAYQTHGRDRGSQLRHSSWHGRRSLDSIGEGSKYDSEFDFTSSPSASSSQSDREISSVSSSALLWCNGRQEYDDVEEDKNEDVKARISCGGALPDTNISADVIRLVSKLCRLTVPEQTGSKQLGHNRSSSVPALTSWDSMSINSSSSAQDIPVLGRQTSLKLLCERCSFGPTPAYNLPKPRKIRHVEPYQHFYKPISKALDQKLRS